MTKLQMMIESIESKIKWEQKNIDRCMEQVKDCANSGKTYEVVTFLPGYTRELSEAVERQNAYTEQLRMLEFLQKDEEN